ncbi:HET-domain-containing protein [Rhizodiscina lignyota]|uniref:HET-domain-containing protein n=1 Tax=Rhizodiscina lignyota TaxID=1504668 RepID=A0A9P4M6G8_9PEZI|nr:HET-domain-containing protein [Rhizodiscina lignyota]
MPPELPTYRYRPLESDSTVRILALHRATDHSASLNCNIIHRDLETECFPHDLYEAVSYAWEGQQPCLPLVCDGTATLHITPNVDSFLRVLRRTHATRYLWVDAVCLNQTDGYEKGKQVSRMREIFRHARKAHIWLGEEAGGEADLFTSLERLARLPLDALDLYLIGSEDSIDSDDEEEEIETLCKTQVQVLDTLLRRPWFTRRWILQEVTLSRYNVVRCGMLTIRWTVFKDALSCLTLDENLNGMTTIQTSLSICTLSDRADRFKLLRKSRVRKERHTQMGGDKWRLSWRGKAGNEESLHLLDLLVEFRNSNCSDERDRVLALVGLAVDGSDFDLIAGYNVTLLEFWIMCAGQQFTKQHNVYGLHQLLSLASSFRSAEDEETLPSWVPNWASTPTYALPQYSQGLLGGVSPKSRSMATPLGRSLHCQTQFGYCGKILWTSTITPNSASLRDVYSHLLSSMIEGAATLLWHEDLITGSFQPVPLYLQHVLQRPGFTHNFIGSLDIHDKRYRNVLAECLIKSLLATLGAMCNKSFSDLKDLAEHPWITTTKVEGSEMLQIHSTVEELIADLFLQKYRNRKLCLARERHEYSRGHPPQFFRDCIVISIPTFRLNSPVSPEIDEFEALHFGIAPPRTIAEDQVFQIGRDLVEATPMGIMRSVTPVNPGGQEIPAFNSSETVGLKLSIMNRVSP